MLIEQIENPRPKASFNKLAIGWVVLASCVSTIAAVPILVGDSVQKDGFNHLGDGVHLIENGQAFLQDRNGPCYVQTGRTQTVYWQVEPSTLIGVRRFLLQGERPENQQKIETLGSAPEYQARDKGDCSHYSKSAFDSGWAVKDAGGVVAHNPQLAQIANTLRDKIRAAQPGANYYFKFSP